MEFAKNVFMTLFVAIDPPGLVPIFITLTAAMTPRERRKTARESVILAFAILACTALGGAPLLGTLAISIPAFRIAGGLMLLYIAWEMIFNLRETRKSGTAESSITQDQPKNIAAYPLAIPMIAGPGSITATVLQASAADGDIFLYALLLGMLAAVLFSCWIMFRLAGRIDRLLGFTGRAVLERLLGVVLAALAVQIVGDGIHGFTQDW